VTPQTATNAAPDIGDPTASCILAALEICADGATRWELSNLLGRNKPAAELDRAIRWLLEHGRIGFEREETGGRPSTRYWLK
jgi:hypothetical protein